jgi:probable rRNA maturation factor
MKVNVFINTALPEGVKPSSAALAKTVLAGLQRFSRAAGEVNLIIVDDAEITRLNKSFLRKDRATDVISFSHPQFPGIKGQPFGDIYICADAAQRQGRELGHGAMLELFTLAAHGALHLAGHDDNTLQKRAAMNAIAEKIARLYCK